MTWKCCKLTAVSLTSEILICVKFICSNVIDDLDLYNLPALYLRWVNFNMMTPSFHLFLSLTPSLLSACPAIITQRSSFPSILHPSTCSLVRTLLHDSSTVRVLSDLQQDLLHVSVFARGIDQLCDLLLQRPRQRHQLDKLALRAFVNLREHKLSGCTLNYEKHWMGNGSSTRVMWLHAILDNMRGKCYFYMLIFFFFKSFLKDDFNVLFRIRV